jgi:hypothetical protein
MNSNRSDVFISISEVVLHPFIIAYGYQENIEKLIRCYRRKRSPYKNWVFPVNLGFKRREIHDERNEDAKSFAKHNQADRADG